MRASTPLWVLGLCLGAPAAAGELERAIVAFQGADYATAIPVIRRQAEAGNAEAQMFMGYAYQSGMGLEANNTMAAHWYRRAAQRGEPTAQMELGLMYELGRGVTPDGGEAEYWYGRAVAQDYCPGELPAGGRLAPP